MEQSTKISVDPITGLGIIANRVESFGKKASRMRIGPMAKAMTRLVVPVAIESPKLEKDVDCPSPPRRPPP